MTQHRFRDEHGIWWDAWEVWPTSAERRQRERRGRPEGAHGRQPPPGTGDRRQGGDRRTVRECRAPVSPALQGGWVVFQSPAERRRLAPIPERWELLDEGELRSLCARATAAARARRLIE